MGTSAIEDAQPRPVVAELEMPRGPMVGANRDPQWVRRERRQLDVALGGERGDVSLAERMVGTYATLNGRSAYDDPRPTGRSPWRAPRAAAAPEVTRRHPLAGTAQPTDRTLGRRSARSLKDRSAALTTATRRALSTRLTVAPRNLSPRCNPGQLWKTTTYSHSKRIVGVGDLRIRGHGLGMT